LRGLIDDLATVHPLFEGLPGLFQEPDDPLQPYEPSFLRRFLSAFDDQLAPIFCTLDNLDAYLDPGLTPTDFLDWLAGWVGVALDENWPLERRRELVAKAVSLYRMRGTVRGLSQEVEMLTGVVPEIVEPGGVAVSSTAEGALPGAVGSTFLVRLKVPEGTTVDLPRLHALIAGAKPAHSTAEVEVVSP
jgi:phage tail-like protein